MENLRDNLVIRGISEQTCLKGEKEKPVNRQQTNMQP
jgi:hypothetical protein